MKGPILYRCLCPSRWAPLPSSWTRHPAVSGDGGVRHKESPIEGYCRAPCLFKGSFKGYCQGFPHQGPLEGSITDSPTEADGDLSNRAQAIL